MASRSVNKCIFVGRLGKDAESVHTTSGTCVTKFSIATERRWKDTSTDDWKSETTWVNIVLWRAEKLAEYLIKGTQVYIEGRLQTRNYEKEGHKVYVTEVVAEEVILLGGGLASGSGHEPASAPRSAPRPMPARASAPPRSLDDDLDSVPF
jgi:single-strand DNA-binding protein